LKSKLFETVRSVHEWNGINHYTHNETEGCPSFMNAARTTTRIPNWFHAADVNSLTAAGPRFFIILVQRN